MAQTQNKTTQREFTVKEGLAYAFGAVGIQLLTTMMLEWSAYYYCPPKGSGHVMHTTLELATLIMMIGVFSDAVSDPIVGWWSDRTRSRLGRRRPFILYGAPLACGSFVLFWFPPLRGTGMLNFAWGTFFAIVFFWGVTIVLIPYLALLPEMARTEKGRVRLGVYQAMGMIVGLVLGFVSGILIENVGFRITAVIFGAVALASFVTCGMTIRERFDPDSEEQMAASVRDLASQLAGTLKNRPFVIFLAAETIFTLGITVIQIILPDYNSVVLKKDEGFVTMLFLPFLCVCFPLIFVIEPMVKKWSTKWTYATGIFGFAAVFPFLYFVGRVQDPGLRVTLLLVLIGFAGAPQAVKYVLPGPLIGEIADYDEKFTGRRREALYSGAIGFAMKTAAMLGFLVRWAVYKPFGEFSVNNPTPVLLIGPVTAVICFIGFFIFLKYPVFRNQDMEDR